MKPKLTPKDAGVTITFLSKVDLKGSESEVLAYIKSILSAIRDGRELPDPVDSEKTDRCVI